MKKSATKAKREKKLKSFSFFTRITTLIVLAAAIVISAVFSIFYLDDNRNLSIEFTGGYQAQIQYTGVHEKDNNTQAIIDLLEKRIDPMGTSNINIEKNETSSGQFYNLSISKNAGIDMPTFINNLSRRGYLYLLDDEGHDLLANDYNATDKTWTARKERITVSEAFSKISNSTNTNSHQPEVTFTANTNPKKDSDDSEPAVDIIKLIQDVIKTEDGNGNKVHFYSDLGSLLNYVRNTLTGLEDLANVIRGVTDQSKKESLMAIFRNDTVGLGYDDGTAMYNAIQSQSSPSGQQLRNLLNQSRNGIYTIEWEYSDISNDKSILVDTNSKDNVFDPAKPFDPDKVEKSNSPLNAWLPYIKDLIELPDISHFLDTSIINYKYAPYNIGTIDASTNSINGSTIAINDNTFNTAKVRQISSLLTVGTETNDVTVQAFLNVDPTLGAQALKAAVIALAVAIGILSLLILANYRLLGLIAIFIIILFMVLTLVSFTFLGNIVAPETGIALIIGLALLLDLIVGLFNNFKAEYQSGKNIINAFKAANKKSLVSAFDCSLIILIASLTIFWFGSRSIRGFAIMTSISTFGVIVLGVLVLRLVLYLLLKNNVFEGKAHWLALTKNTKESKKTKKPKNIKVNQVKDKLSTWVAQTKGKTTGLNASKWNYHRSTKWIITSFAVILVTAGIVFLAAGANFGQGFNSHIDLIGEADVRDDLTDPNLSLVNIATQYRDEVETTLHENNKSYQKVYWALKLNTLNDSPIRIIIETNLKNNKSAVELREFLQTQATWATWSYATNDGLSGNQLFKNMLIAIAISLITIFLYIIIRFQFSFTIPLLVSLIVGIFVTLAILVTLQITISTMTIGILLAVITLILINSVIIFDNIKALKLNLTRNKKDQLQKDEIIAISNEGVKRSLSRTLMANGIIIVTAVIVFCFLPSFWAVSLALIFGSVVSFLVSHFLAPWLWTYFERWRIRRSQKRAKKIKKHFVGPDELIVPGIND